MRNSTKKKVLADFSAPQGYVYYVVEIMLNETCDVGKAGSSIKSNIATNNPGVGIEPITNDALRITPNPTTGQLTIDNGQLTIKNVEIFDAFGKKQLTIDNGQLTINISHLSNGIYFLKITTEKGVVTKNIIKQ